MQLHLDVPDSLAPPFLDGELSLRLLFQQLLKYLNRGFVQELYRAIADPHRRTILRVLRHGERTAGELASVTGLRPAALTHHLMVLKLADLVRVERRGQYQIYSLNTTVFQDLVTEILGWLTDPGTESEPGLQTKGDLK